MVSRSATLFARAGTVAAGARSLWTRTTDAEKFQRVAQIPEPILLRDFFLRVTDGAGDVDEHDLTTPATDKMIVVFPGVTDLVVAAFLDAFCWLIVPEGWELLLFFAGVDFTNFPLFQ